MRIFVGFLTLLGAIRVAESGVDFEREVAPIFEAHCVRCHNETNQQGELSLSSADDIEQFGYVIADEPQHSYLLDMVRPTAADPPRMPKEGERLSKEQVATLTRWIAAGAVWPKNAVVQEKSAADKNFWSLKPVSKREPPVTDGISAAWTENVIDRFVFAKLAKQGLEPNPPADRRTLIRRATYDLTGLPPTPEEVEAFVNVDSAGAYRALVDRLLDSPRYGERWGRHWLDVARFGESGGYERNRIIDTLWPYRDYVIRSFNEDKPFDRFVIEQLAGDMVGKNDPEVEIGTAFLVCGPHDDVGNQDVKAQAVIRANEIDDIVRATSEAFLGLTVGCARCHDHKFDPIEQKDYYRMVSAFGGVHHGERPIATSEQWEAYRRISEPLAERRKALEASERELRTVVEQRAEANAELHSQAWTRPTVDPAGTEERFDAIDAKFVRLTVSGLTSRRSGKSFFLDEFEVYPVRDGGLNVALSANGATASASTPKAEDFDEGYGIHRAFDGDINTRAKIIGTQVLLELAEVTAIERVFFSSDRLGLLQKDYRKASFPAEYQLEVSVDGRRWQTVADTSGRTPFNNEFRAKRLFEAEITPEERSKLEKIRKRLVDTRRALDDVEEPPLWYAGKFKLPENPQFHVFLGGNPERKGPPVRPASLSVLSEVTDGFSLNGDAGEGERRLALAEWIVDAKNPLTPRVLANRLWHYHFGTGIVATPSDFGYMGDRPSHPELLDWLAAEVHRHGWRLKPLHRQIMLSQTYRQASTWREDAANVDSSSRLLWRFPPRRLSAEELRDTMLQVAGKLDTTMGGPGFRLYRYTHDNVATYYPLDEHGPETYRRAVYHKNARAATVDLLSEFDCPENAFAAPRRAATTTPLQALTMLNHGFTLDMSKFMAARLRSEIAGGDAEAHVRRAFHLCYGRKPVEQEATAAVTLIEKHGLSAFCRALLNSTEMIHID
ncbi:DUF1553 domain-containing protein [Stratiformator vulcanicus]|uniref:Planctomycete cytochrome C n=1 Tax=Stratiformator vulcanicus TaxID=2527980 RepID=A0A517QYD3_9PLAN|nr:DUF1553 domain-containing protein [Stratiformator vulcanicus]QDT36641.1 hypothetical protein Pan189_10020 [Stratiformator vulcanicus]